MHMLIKNTDNMAKKIKKYKVGLDSETYAISLVEFPAIEEELVALSQQEPVKIQLADEEKHMVYSAVLVPDKPIYRRNENGDEYYLEFSKESIEKMSQEFLKEYRQAEVTVDHKDMASDVTVVETWLKSDMVYDKSLAIGLNKDLPIGTWFAGMKVNQIDVWDRIKNGSIRGYSVESLISLEEFNKIENNDNMNLAEDMNFWKKMKEVIRDAFKKDEVETTPSVEELAEESGFTNVEDYKKEVEAIKEELEEQTPTVEAPTEATETPTEPSKDAEPTTTPPEENKATEEPENEPTEKDNHLEDILKSVRAEVEALKELNKDLTAKVKSLEKEPSTKPINPTTGKGKGDSYSQWRERVKQMIG